MRFSLAGGSVPLEAGFEGKCLTYRFAPLLHASLSNCYACSSLPCFPAIMVGTRSPTNTLAFLAMVFDHSDGRVSDTEHSSGPTSF